MKVVVGIGAFVIIFAGWIGLQLVCRWAADYTGRDLENLMFFGGAVWALAVYRPIQERFLP